jgi:LysM repeat protein
VGQQLRIPGAGTSAATALSVAPGGTYVVRAGDSLIAIAARHGVSASQLASANGLSTNGWVYVGQRLQIPGASTAPAPSAPSAPSAPASPGAPADRGPSSSSWQSVRSTAVTSPGGTYVVRAGDTLISIAARHKVTVADLARTNGMYSNSWVYTGQQLKIPGGPGASASTTPTSPAASSAPMASPGGTYVVRPGDSLTQIAVRHAVSVSRLAAVNGLQVDSWVYVGQRLQIPGGSTTPPATSPSTTVPSNPPAPAPAPSGASGKWIDVNLTTQTVTAFEGQTPVFTALASTGTWRTPTVVGTFSIYVKYTSTRMRGPGYDLPNVPYTMYFYRGYGLHGTYWHNNFGTPMSHGCVNLSTPNAQWLFNWAPLGTKVVSHY